MKKQAIHFAILSFSVLLGLAACQGGDSHDKGELNATHKQLVDDVTDMLFNSLISTGNYEQILVMADSLENEGKLNEAEANRWRGDAHARMGHHRTAEFYWNKVIAGGCDGGNYDEYVNTAASLSNLLVNKGDYEGGLRATLPAIQEIEARGDTVSVGYAILLESLGRCQLNLGRTDEASKSYDKAYACYLQNAKSTPNSDALRHALIDAHNTSLSYLTTHYYAEALIWTTRADTLVERLSYLPGASTQFIELVRARLHIQRATALQGLGRQAEAKAAYEAYQASSYGKSDQGRIDATRYLQVAGRYQEAADNFRDLDRILNEWEIDLTPKNIASYLFPKYRANALAGRKDSAIAIGLNILNLMDSTIVELQNNDAAELATIYETQQKETVIAQQQARIAEQEASQSRILLIGTAAALLLIVGFFVTYLLYRQRAQRALATTNEQLQKAYDQLKAATEAKELLEDELHIARNIQMSMLPSHFPDHEGLDIFALMTPAKDVGGDLYDFLLSGSQLYFCIGDVSGKGVPASLFMAQAVRLFRTLATQQMMPSDIATKMNNALVQNNEQGMFITMFIGLVDLTTGHLDFCNAGHNPPVLFEQVWKGSFLQMESNAPIGLWPELKFVGEEIDNIKDRPLFLYTDGLNEAENKYEEQFGDEQLINIFRKEYASGSHQLIEHMQAAVEKHRDGAEPSDDLTMMYIHIR